MFFGALEHQHAIPDDAVQVLAPRVSIPTALQTMADAHPRARYTWGKSYCDRVRGFYGDYSAAPDFIVQPQDEAQVQQVLDVCDAEQLAVIPFGGGSSVTGGVEARPGKNHRGAITLGMSRMQRLLEVDATSLTAHMQAGNGRS